MSVLVTGGTGFLGRYFIEEALKNGYNLVCTKTKFSKKENIIIKKGVNWIEKDLLDIRECDLKNIDTIVNLASAGVSPKRVSTEELIDINVKAALNLLDVGKKCKVRRFVFVGTCHEYGESANDYNFIPPDAPLKPLNIYGASKAASFFLLQQFCIENELEMVYGRIFSAYGKGQDKRNFWPSLYHAAISGDDFPMSSGKQIRDFIPANLVATHLVNCLKRDDVYKGKPLVINIGTGKEISLKEFALTEWQKLNAKGNILLDRIKDRGDEPLRYIPDISNLFYKL